MKIELDINAITIGPDEKLLIVLPITSAGPLPDLDPETGEYPMDPLVKDLSEWGLGDRVMVVYVDGAQLVKVAAGG